MTTSTDIRLLAWLSPAFPTGAYAYSHGLEWAVEAGDITDGHTLRNWIGTLLTLGAPRSDAILLRHAHRGRGDLDALAELAELAAAAAGSRERQAETLGQGGAFTLAVAAWGNSPLGALAERIGAHRIAYPVAVGAACAAAAITEDAAAAALLAAIAANLVSAAIRLVPLGQTAGLVALAALEPTILAVAAATRGATLDDIGGACLRGDIAAMRHETQYSRLFRS